jgi:hypothetical protein
MITSEWKDFILTRDGTHPDLKARFEIKPNSHVVIHRDFVEKDGDRFEAMKIDELGDVMIWTTTKIWWIVRQGNKNQIERLLFVPRHPTEIP